MARGDQVVRLLSILHRLQAGTHRRGDLAQEFGVSRKTITRDMEALSMFPVVEERDGNDVLYSMLRGHGPNLWLSPPEVLTMLLARQSLEHALIGTPYHEIFVGLLARLEKLGREPRGPRQSLLAVYRIHSSGERSLRDFPAAHIEGLLTCALEMRQIEMVYFSASREERTRRVVDPYCVYQSPHGLRLIGYCRLRGDVRMFSLHQIESFEALSSSFAGDEHFQAFEFERFVEDRFDDMGSPPVLDVRLRIANPTAHWARHRRLHAHQQIVDVENGIEVSFRSGGMPAVAARVLGLGPDCEVLAPDELRHVVAERAAIMARNHAFSK